MVAIVMLSDKETPSTTHSHNNNNYYCNHNEERRVPSIASASASSTKKHNNNMMKSSSSSNKFDLPRTPKTPKRTRTSFSIDKEDWSLYNMAPKSKKRIFYVSDDRLQNAPRLPFFDDNDDCVVKDKMNLPGAPLRSAPSSQRMPFLFLNHNNDDDMIMEEAPSSRLPYFDCDNQKENRAPTISPRFSCGIFH